MNTRRWPPARSLTELALCTTISEVRIKSGVTRNMLAVVCIVLAQSSLAESPESIPFVFDEVTKAVNTLQGKSCVPVSVEQAPVQSNVRDKCTKANSDHATNFTSEDFLAKQANEPFEKRFAPISADLRRTSEGNLKAIHERLGAKRPGFDLYLKKADALLGGVLKKLSFEHETKRDTLKSILKSGSLLSLDELVRRGIVPAKKKTEGSTRAYTDGVTGEQDVVFVAAREAYQSEWASTFGDFTLTFDPEKLLEHGYFTPFAFGNRLAGLSEDFDLSCGFPVYRSWIFQGKEAFREFVRISIAQLLWERDQDLSTVRKTFEEITKRTKTEPQYATGEQPLPMALMAPVFSAFQQVMPGDLPLRYDAFHDVAEQWTGKSRSGEEGFPRRTSDPSHILSLLAAYQGLPSDSGQIPPAILQTSDFWEVKVPREIPLTFLKSIAIPSECLGTGGAAFKWCEGVEEAVLDYVKRSGRKYVVKTMPHRLHETVSVYEFQ